jgi:hypothetical protein
MHMGATILVSSPPEKGDHNNSSSHLIGAKNVIVE